MLIAARPLTATQNRGANDGGPAAAQSQQAHPGALAKAGIELVEERTLAPGRPCPHPELQEYFLSI